MSLKRDYELIDASHVTTVPLKLDSNQKARSRAFGPSKQLIQHLLFLAKLPCSANAKPALTFIAMTSDATLALATRFAVASRPDNPIHLSLCFDRRQQTGFFAPSEPILPSALPVSPICSFCQVHLVSGLRRPTLPARSLLPPGFAL